MHCFCLFLRHTFFLLNVIIGNRNFYEVILCLNHVGIGEVSVQFYSITNPPFSFIAFVNNPLRQSKLVKSAPNSHFLGIL